MDWVRDCLKVMKAMMQSLNVVDRFTKWAIVTRARRHRTQSDSSSCCIIMCLVCLEHLTAL
jgi:hypothetical protein